MQNPDIYIPSVLLVLFLSYLLGSIPSAVWLGKMFHKIDVREHGSGNAGATNTIRVLGWWTGIPVLLIDLGKGWLAAMLPAYFGLAEDGSNILITLKIISGLAAIIGHVFPVFAGFRGGKGVATIFGTLLALHFMLTISCVGVFLAILFATGFVSVASMVAGLSFPVLLFTVFHIESPVFRAFSVVVAVALILTHRKNISRLLKGEESRFLKFRRKRQIS